MAAVAAVENLSATLDAATILELSGETSTSQVREVVVRGMRIASLDADSLCNEQWPRLEAVSLSQNPVGHDAVLWEWFGLCDSLRCLNLNFCGVESIEGLQQLASLEQLFVSTNKIADVSPLAGCPMLQTLILHRNAIAALDPCLATITRLPELTELDLSGNPIWFKPECKHAIVAQLKSLRRYDDELVTELDRELSIEFSEGAAVLPVATRPSTAPATRLAGGRAVHLSPATGTHGFTPHSPSLARQDQCAEPTDRTQSGSGAGFSERNACSQVNVISLGSTGGSFVQRLRKSAAVLSDPVTSIPCAAAVPSLDECLADPTRGVHSLYSIVQELAAKLAAKPESQSGAALPSAPIDVVRALERENTRLKLENSNMYFMKNQNEKLAQQLAQISDERSSTGQDSSSHTDEALQAELDALRHNYRELLKHSAEQHRPTTAAEVIASCEENYDAELAELFRRNERGLREVRQDLESLAAEQPEMHHSQNLARNPTMESKRAAGALQL